MLNMRFGNIHFTVLHMYVYVCAHGPTIEISGLQVLYLRNLSS